MVEADSKSKVDVEEEDFQVFYRDRPDWSDVIPIAQDDGPSPVVAIDYSARFQDVFDYFRGVMHTGEKSYRVLELTEEAIILNAANYTVWQYRRDVLQELKIPGLMTKDGLSEKFEEELRFSQLMIEENQKNYQVWHHRKIVISWAAGYDEETGKIGLTCEESCKRLVSQELELTERQLDKDNKNYHSWQHRQWVLMTFNYFTNEIEYVNSLLEEDVRNNSAWNQRYFIIVNSKKCTIELLNEEIEYTWSQITKAPHNESPWSYLRGLITLSSRNGESKQDEVQKKCQELYDTGNKNIHMLGLMLDITQDILTQGPPCPKIFNQAIEICDSLIGGIDLIRKAYWSHMKKTLICNFGKDYQYSK